MEKERRREIHYQGVDIWLPCETFRSGNSSQATLYRKTFIDSQTDPATLPSPLNRHTFSNNKGKNNYNNFNDSNSNDYIDNIIHHSNNNININIIFIIMMNIVI
ncbi:hypothetical protein PoB_007041000 [Plakobranchus ocellatus]|uniref:Uncharacterized protein n=1 Tax=Plakobranchus ocellatus TaxID=259542 RepID=A0AAV4DIS1_9GAST|nr:hypothetical protein PoB_007041000 [Plakobranchus ocellatus]